MRICIVYDCLYPYTVGGAERWYRELAERLVAEGHDVTYLTLRQWERGARLDLDPRISVHAVGPRMALYTGDRRRILPPLRFGSGVLAHLLRHGHRYEVVYTASFPYFSLLAAGVAARLYRYRLVVDWHEVWSEAYWREYLGPLGGRIGHAVQRLCARIPQRAFCFSRLYAQRLRAEGMRGELTILRGQYQPSGRTPSAPASTTDEQGAGAPVLFAGRMIPEKQVLLGLEAVAIARARLPELQACFFGEGPQRRALLARIERLGLADCVSAPGFVSAEVLAAAMRGALCLLLPSRREGYGKVVVEAAAFGTPSIVVAGQDNAATELIEDGVNGFLVTAADPHQLSGAIIRVKELGAGLRGSTRRWFSENESELALESSLERVLASFRSS
ncbi:MAG TPA: glycosyltransferase [Solirubrobacteraceae bacterium]|nr:glycosyltransferase [Solirubrobacteraceae bacterium]